MPKAEKTRTKTKDKRISNNTGWHMEMVPGQGLIRVSHNPRLIDTHPHLVKEWHPTKNGSYTPSTVTALSTYRAWWLCARGHEWRRQVNRRAFHDSPCPHCEAESASLAARFRKLAKQWSKKNSFGPEEVRWSAEDLVWWTCPVKDHDDYQRTVYNRTNAEKPLGCPVCEGHQPEKSESFAARFPKLRKEWHPHLNGELNPFHFSSGSSQLVWWRCEKNKEHEWPAPIVHRTQRNPECPYCRLWYVTDENRLSTRFPELAAEFHPKKNRFLWPHIEGSFKVVSNLRIPPHLREKNRRLKPSDLAINCDEVFWWKCKARGHEWEGSVEDRAIRGKGCPECEKLKLATEKSLAALLPGLAKLWHPTRNGQLKPTDVVPGSRTMVVWRCPKSATHVWKAPVYSVVRSWKDGSNGCRWCSGLSVDEKNSLLSKCPAVAKLWHTQKNGKLLPSEVTVKSNKIVWWHCGKPKHEFQAKVCNMVAAFERGSNGCKFCAGRAAAPDNCLKRTFPAVAKLWHPTKNGDLTPDDVTQGSGEMVVWLCDFGHDWEAKVSYVVQSFRLGSAAKGCPYCAGKKRWRT